jgi:hypothetical protein
MCEVAMDCAADRQEGGPIGAGAPGRVGSGRVGEAPRHRARGGRQDGPAVKAAILRLIPCASRGSPARTLHDHARSRLQTGFAAPGRGTRPGDEAGGRAEGRAELSQGTRASSTLA